VKSKNNCFNKKRSVGAGIAAAINFLIFFISKGVGISYTIPPRMTQQQPIDVTATGIILFSVVPAVVATILLMILNRYSKKHCSFL
jgi:ABC-type microcin C transport system permease subunit YejB